MFCSLFDFIQAIDYLPPHVFDLIQTINYLPSEVFDFIQTINYLPPEVFDLILDTINYTLYTIQLLPI